MVSENVINDTITPPVVPEERIANGSPQHSVLSGNSLKSGGAIVSEVNNSGDPTNPIHASLTWSSSSVPAIPIITTTQESNKQKKQGAMDNTVVNDPGLQPPGDDSIALILENADGGNTSNDITTSSVSSPDASENGSPVNGLGSNSYWNQLL